MQTKIVQPVLSQLPVFQGLDQTATNKHIYKSLVLSMYRLYKTPFNFSGIMEVNSALG